MNWLSNVTNLPPSRTRQLIFIGLGFALVIFGFLWMAVPLLIGSLMVLAGVYILLRNSSIARRIFVRFKNRYPGVLGWVDAWRRRRRQ